MADDLGVRWERAKTTNPLELSICAIHGLNGNAFDTWAWEGRVMWLRDFLPKEKSLARLRVMTFGYSSLARDKKNTSSLFEWSSDLLQSISAIRRSESVRFALHSPRSRCLPYTTSSRQAMLPWGISLDTTHDSNHLLSSIMCHFKHHLYIFTH